MGFLRRHRSLNGLPPMPFEVYLRNMDVDAYADTLFASAPSLKEVLVSVSGPPDECTRQADRRRTEPEGHNTASAASQESKDDK